MPHTTFPTVSNHSATFNVALQAAQGVVQKSTLGMLKDVNAVGVEDNQAIIYNNANEKWEAKSLTSIPTIIPQDLSDLKDVDDTAPTNGQALVFNGTSSLWEPSTTGTVSSNIGQLNDVDIATLAPYAGAKLEYSVDGSTQWAVSPKDNVVIWVTPAASGGSDANNGLTTGTSLATMQTAIQRALQKGSIVNSMINLQLADIPWDTSARNLINTSLLSGPSFTTFIMDGHSEDFSTETGTGATKTTNSILTGYAITNGGQTISNGWNVTTFDPATVKWGEIDVGGAVRVLPVLVDDQTQNTGARVYISYWNRSMGTGFVTTPTFKLRSLKDSTVITHSTSFYGPMSFTNLILKGPNGGNLNFLNDVNMQYVELQSTTPGTTMNMRFNGQNSQCSFCRFTDQLISCNGSSSTPTGSSTTTFLNCIFYNCSFNEAENVEFLGCIFYKNPLLFNNISVKASFDTCTFIYSFTPTTAGLMNTVNSNITMSNCIIDTQNYASGTVALTIPLFITDNSALMLNDVKVLDGVLDQTTGGLNIFDDNSAYILAQNQSKIIVTAGTLTSTGPGTRALFVGRSASQISLTNLTVDAAAHTLLSLIDADANMYEFDDQLKLVNVIYALRSNIVLNTIKIVANTANLITASFMTLTSCTVTGGEGGLTSGIYVDLNHTTTTKFLDAIDSIINLALVANTTNDTMYGTIALIRSTLRGRVQSNGQKTTIFFLNGTGNAGSNLGVRSSIVSLQDISFLNSHTTNGKCIQAQDNSNVDLEFFEVAALNGVTTANDQALLVENNSHVTMNGKFQFVSSVADDQPTIECSGGSSISLTPNFTLGDSARLTIQRNSASGGTVPVISITEGSKLFIANRSNDRNNSANANAITVTSPRILLKGLSTNNGQGPFLIDNSICQIEQSIIEFNKLNGPGIIRNKSKFIAGQCSIVDTSGSGQRLNYFNVQNSELIITGKGADTVSYIPELHVQALASADQGVILASNSNIVFADIEVENIDTQNALQTLIKASNGSNVIYDSPIKDAQNGLGVGVQLRSNSKCSYKSAGAGTPLACTVDLLLGDSSGAVDTQRKLDDMSLDRVTGAISIIPKQTGLANYIALQGFIDAAEGCHASVIV